MPTKDRIVQFIDFKLLSKRKFCEKVGMSHTIFNSDSAIGSDKLELIFTAYPELNLDWIVTGRGEMLNAAVVPTVTDWKAEYEKVSLKYQDVMEKLITCTEEKEGLKKRLISPKEDSERLRRESK